MPRKKKKESNIPIGDTNHSTRRFLAVGLKNESIVFCLLSNLALPIPPLVLFRPWRWSRALTRTTVNLKVDFSVSSDDGMASTLISRYPVLLQEARNSDLPATEPDDGLGLASLVISSGA